MKTTLRKIALPALLVSLSCTTIFAQRLPPGENSDFTDDLDSTDASYLIFSNLESTPGERYNTDISVAVAGKNASITEEWHAIRIIPTVDVQAKVLLAAIGYTSGTKLVALGIYSNNDLTGSVGDPLPGGQGSTSQIPDAGECCGLTRVTLAGEGVTLTTGTEYWLVAGPDNLNAGLSW